MFRHGPELVEGGVRFRVFAPRLERLAVRVDGQDHPMERGECGAFSVLVRGAGHGTNYQLVLPGGEARPDPASRWQPQGVHGPSRVFDPGLHLWRTTFPGRPLEELVFYELHVGAFSEEGTLASAAERLDDLAELGVTCVELMPVQPFPGSRNWGYDGVYPWAVHQAYGGPAALQDFVDRAHVLGLAVCLDVVHNHLGPEGNYTANFAPFFTARHRSPWGDGLDFDGQGAGPVRDFFVGSALQWVREFQVDALRLDATHAIMDQGPRHLVAEVVEATAAEAARSGRRIQIVAEDERNDRRVLDPPPRGWGCSAVWADDLHHALHALLTGERGRFLCDFGSPDEVVEALAHGFAFRGRPSAYRGGRTHGTDVQDLAPSRFVVCDQNHDQVGNRPLGERLTTLMPWEALRPVSTLLLLGSGLPLLFMGEEYGEEHPFLYFTSHADPALGRAVSEGRRAEYFAEAGGQVPDPQDPETFRRSRLSHRRDGRHGQRREEIRQLLSLRRQHLSEISQRWPTVERDGLVFTLRRPRLLVRANLSAEARSGLPPWGTLVRSAAPA
ncbi:MAG TPA: malto-oligosyltrehalose trehalohydrolase [Anaeromyxobacter sp.]|nr:malto-oligosyltrehalose trehalohydrolase [Anaeromyxobacter sp.]